MEQPLPGRTPALGRQVGASLQTTHLLDAHSTGCWEMPPPSPSSHPCLWLAPLCPGSPCLKGSETTEGIVIDIVICFFFFLKKKRKGQFLLFSQSAKAHPTSSNRVTEGQPDGSPILCYTMPIMGPWNVAQGSLGLILQFPGQKSGECAGVGMGVPLKEQLC